MHMAEPVRRQCAVQTEQCWFAGSESQQNADRLVSKSAEAEVEHVGGGPVEPLRVIHGDYKGCRAGENLESLQDPPREHPLIRQGATGPRETSRRRTWVWLAKKRGLHGMSVRFRKRGKDVTDDVAK